MFARLELSLIAFAFSILSEMLMHVTLLEQFIKLYMQILGILSGPRFARLELSLIAFAFSILSESFISGKGILVAMGALGSFLDFLLRKFSFFFFFFGLSPSSPSSSSS